MGALRSLERMVSQEQVPSPTFNRAYKSKGENMKIKTILLTAVLALSAGIGAGFSGDSFAAGNNRACKFDCKESYYNCMLVGSTVYCQNRYNACLADCEINPY